MKKGKKKTSIQARRRLFFIRPICIIALFLLVATFISNSFILYKLTIEKKQKEDELVELEKISENLKVEITKLNNPEYIARYARENYSYSKDGELVIKLDKKEEKKEKNIETSIAGTKINYKIPTIIVSALFTLYILSFFIRKKGETS